MSLHSAGPQKTVLMWKAVCHNWCQRWSAPPTVLPQSCDLTVLFFILASMMRPLKKKLSCTSSWKLMTALCIYFWQIYAALCCTTLKCKIPPLVFCFVIRFQCDMENNSFSYSKQKANCYYIIVNMCFSLNYDNKCIRIKQIKITMCIALSVFWFVFI